MLKEVEQCYNKNQATHILPKKVAVSGAVVVAMLHEVEHTESK